MFCFKKETFPSYFIFTFLAMIFANSFANAQSKIPVDTISRHGIFIPDSLFNFGKVKPLHKLNHTFYFTNNTNDTVIIDKLIPSCECTTARCNKQKIFPFSKTAVTTTVDLTGVTGEKFVAIEIFLKGEDVKYDCYIQGEIIEVKK